MLLKPSSNFTKEIHVCTGIDLFKISSPSWYFKGIMPHDVMPTRCHIGYILIETHIVWIQNFWNWVICVFCLSVSIVFQCSSGSQEITLICFFSVLFRECTFSWLKWKEEEKQGRISARILFCSIRHHN